MKLPELKIGNKVARVPIQQGGMAIRLSTARLAAAVANEGGIGLIAASGMSHDELRYEITSGAKDPRFLGWTLAQFLIADTNMKNAHAWRADWDLLRSSNNVDEDWIQFYESSGSIEHTSLERRRQAR